MAIRRTEYGCCDVFGSATGNLGIGAGSPPRLTIFTVEEDELCLAAGPGSDPDEFLRVSH